MKKFNFLSPLKPNPALEDFPLLPLILGLILGQMTESNLSAAWLMSGHSLWGLLDRPIAMGLLVVAALSIVLSLRMRARQRRKTIQEQLMNSARL